MRLWRLGSSATVSSFEIQPVRVCNQRRRRLQTAPELPLPPLAPTPAHEVPTAGHAAIGAQLPPDKVNLKAEVCRPASLPIPEVTKPLVAIGAPRPVTFRADCREWRPSHGNLVRSPLVPPTTSLLMPVAAAAFAAPSLRLPPAA